MNDRRRSGEHPTADNSISAHAFYNFMDEFRAFAGNTDTKLEKIKKELAEGSTRFAIYEQKIIEQQKRSDEHSDQIEVLRIDKIQREAEVKQREKDTSPRNELLRDVIKAVVIAAVLSTCAITYNIIRDHEVQKVVKNKENTPSVVPPKELPASPAPRAIP